MTQGDIIAPEYKTIRLPAQYYYKLAELAGLVATIRGENVSISEMGSLAVKEIHDLLYQHFLEIVSHPKKLAEMRNEFVHNRKQLSELVRDVKVTE